MSLRFNVPESEYRADPSLSVHLLHEFHRSPAHYQLALRGETKEATPAMLLGRAVHCAVLEPDRFTTSWVCGPESRRGKAWEQAELVAKHDGAEILPEPEHQKVVAIADAVRAHPAAAQLLAGSVDAREVSWFADIDDQHGGTRPAKGRADAIAFDRGVAWDLKTCQNASPEFWQKVTLDYRYHVQGAYYLDGLALCGHPNLLWVVVAVETAPPYAVSVIWNDEKWIDAGRLAYRDDLWNLRDREQRNDWSAYGTGVHTLGADGWVGRKITEGLSWESFTRPQAAPNAPASLSSTSTEGTSI